MKFAAGAALVPVSGSPHAETVPPANPEMVYFVLVGAMAAIGIAPSDGTSAILNAARDGGPAPLHCAWERRETADALRSIISWLEA